MRRFETLLALLAVVLASLSALPIPGRILLALCAIFLIALVGSLRLRAAIKAKSAPPSRFDAAARAEQIREERRRRTERL
jgi:multisubunit Na+/H+ antiporter MnhG subunit